MTNPKAITLIQKYSDDALWKFINDRNHSLTRAFEPLWDLQDESHPEVNKLGEIEFSTAERLIVCSIAVARSLNERSGKKQQYDLAKKILTRYNNDFDGIFVFHDPQGNFRFSLIYANYFGTRKSFSNYRRFTYYVSTTQTNKTFINRMTEGDFKTLDGIKEAFSVEKVTKEFYQDISNWFDWALRIAEFPTAAVNKENGKEMSVIRLITRMIFIWFMRVKGFISNDLFDKEIIKWQVAEIDDPDSSSYFHAVLQNLFFATLSTEVSKRQLRADPGYKNMQHDYGKPEIFRFKKLFFNQATINDLFTDIPFLNGGLFTCLDVRKDSEHGVSEEVFIDGFSDNPKNQAKVPNRLFFGEETKLDLNQEYDTTNKVYVARGLLNTLDRYNFTIDENTPDDQDVALDPELLGQVFENLLARVNPETSVAARKETGSFYTPREIVDFMVDESLLAFFQSYLQGVADESDDLEDRLRNLISYHAELPDFSESEKMELIQAIDQIKVLDPAVGSGAFPMGMLNKLVYILGRLDPNNIKWKDLQYEKAIQAIASTSKKVQDELTRTQRIKEIEKAFDSRVDSDYGRKLYIIRNSIYGVDIQPMAIHIAKLRFFISLIVEQKMEKDKPEENFGILTLPNLETKFVAANSLLHLYDKPASILPKPKVEITEEIKKDVEGIIRRFEMLQTATIPYIRDRIRQEAIDLSFKVNHALRADPDYSPIDVPKAFETAKTVKDLKAFLPNQEEKQEQSTFGIMEIDPDQLYLELSQIRELHFKTSSRAEKERLEEEDRKVRLKLRGALKTHTSWGRISDKKIGLLAKWDPYDQNSVAPFFDPRWMFDVKDGFDIVLGNPPYIQLQKLASTNPELQTKYANAGYQTHAATGDIYCLFYEMGYSVLKWRTGILAFITSNKWMRAGYGKKLRDFFNTYVDPILLIDFAGQRVFTTATVDVNIMVFRKSKTDLKTKACTIEEPCLNVLGDYLKQHQLSTSFKSDNSWIILDSIEKSIKDKVETLGAPLSGWDIKINRGILTGFNQAFIISGAKRQEIINSDPKSAEIIRPILRGRDIKRGKVNFADLYLINTHNGLPSKGINPIDVNNYPAIKKHLDNYWRNLFLRLDQGDTPYNLRSCGYLEDFAMQKVVYSEIVRSPSFYLDRDGEFFVEATGFLMTGSQLEYLIHWLNSPIMASIFKRYYAGGGLGQNGYRYKKAFLEKLPIPKPNIFAKEEISQDTIINYFGFNTEEINFLSSVEKP